MMRGCRSRLSVLQLLGCISLLFGILGLKTSASASEHPLLKLVNEKHGNPDEGDAKKESSSAAAPNAEGQESIFQPPKLESKPNPFRRLANLIQKDKRSTAEHDKAERSRAKAVEEVQSIQEKHENLSISMLQTQIEMLENELVLARQNQVKEQDPSSAEVRLKQLEQQSRELERQAQKDKLKERRAVELATKKLSEETDKLVYILREEKEQAMEVCLQQADQRVASLQARMDQLAEEKNIQIAALTTEVNETALALQGERNQRVELERELDVLREELWNETARVADLEEQKETVQEENELLYNRIDAMEEALVALRKEKASEIQRITSEKEGEIERILQEKADMKLELENQASHAASEAKTQEGLLVSQLKQKEMELGQLEKEIRDRDAKITQLVEEQDAQDLQNAKEIDRVLKQHEKTQSELKERAQQEMQKIQEKHEQAVNSLLNKFDTLEQKHQDLAVSYDELRRQHQSTSKEAEYWSGLHRQRSYCNFTHMREDVVEAASSVYGKASVVATPHVDKVYKTYVKSYFEQARPHYDRLVAPAVQKASDHGHMVVDKLVDTIQKTCPRVLEELGAHRGKTGMSAAFESTEVVCRSPRDSVLNAIYGILCFVVVFIFLFWRRRWRRPQKSNQEATTTKMEEKESSSDIEVKPNVVSSREKKSDSHK